MERPGKMSCHPIESDYEINGSCIRSDIDNLIRKMYTPMVERSDTPIIDEDCCDYTRTRANGNTEMTLTEQNETPNKRFGFYFETVTTRNNVRTLMDSSTSDSVSLPSVRRKLKNPTLICKCCRRKISNQISGKPVTNDNVMCTICLKGKVIESREMLNRQSRTQNPSIYTGQGDVVRGSKCIKHCCQPFCEMDRLCKHVTTSACNRHLRSKQENRLVCQKHVCNHSILSEKQNIQIVPHHDVSNDINTRNKLKNTPDSVREFKIINTKSFKRFITNVIKWPSTLRTNETLNSTEVANADRVQNDVSKVMTDNQARTSLIYQDLPSTNGKPSKPRRGCGHLLHNAGRIENLLNEDGEDQHDNKDNPNQDGHVKSSVISVEHKLPKSQNKIQKNEIQKEIVTIKSSSMENVTLTMKATSLEELSRDPGSICCHRLEEEKLNDETKLAGKETSKPHPNCPTKLDDVYCLDYENTEYCKRREILTEKTDLLARQFWEWVFGVCHFLPAFITAFILQLLKFVLHSLVCPLLWGTVKIGSFYFFKPCLETLFSSVLQPVFIFTQNVATSFRDLCLPIAQCFGYFMKEIAHICRACRLVEIHNTNTKNLDPGNP